MKSTITLLVCLLSCTFSLSAQSIPSHSKTDLIIKFKADIEFDKANCLRTNIFGQQKLDDLNYENGLNAIQITGNRKLKNAYCLKFKAEKDIYTIMESYLETGLFEFVEPNFIGQGHSLIPNDQFFFRQYGLLNNGVTANSIVDADIDMDLAWEIEQGDESIVVAVLDSGLKLDHPEFEGRLWVNEDEVNSNSDSDENGFADDINGWNFAFSNKNPKDFHGHGTNVAGILAATGNNSIGYAGVDWNCKIMTCKILGFNNAGLYTWWTDAIYYAVDNGADVINMSVGGSGFSLIMQEAANYAYNKDVTIVVSMGNENIISPLYPAGYDSTISVGSTSANDHRTAPFSWNSNSGSNYGDHIDIVAPGSLIYGLDYFSNSNYNLYWGGTSQAAPLVAGVSSLLLAQNPERTPDEIRWILRNTAEDQVGSANEDTPGFDIYYGYGRLNAFEALNSDPISSIATEEKSENSLSIYPNPSSGRLIIEHKSINSSISIFTINGKKVYYPTQKQSSDEINLDHLENGIYFIHIENKKSKAQTIQKFIIQK